MPVKISTLNQTPYNNRGEIISITAASALLLSKPADYPLFSKKRSALIKSFLLILTLKKTFIIKNSFLSLFNIEQ